MELKKENAVYNTENPVLISQLKADGFEEVLKDEKTAQKQEKESTKQEDKAGKGSTKKEGE
ncbi:hypothetical protein HCB35_04690 [Listeria booriae]|uniref:Uncharacterized protein n=2 Tax=Listeria booriae TaxID=1552123 RepID=A0A841WG49_9LIST|nr:hypothetical protein [Listeria booriae]MBC1801117.1 hypothetical protein [Listeria booriae]MBC2239762.1 hypothetical protein [Listeria booriae]